MADWLSRISWKVLLGIGILFATVAISTAVGLILRQLDQSNIQSTQNNALLTCRARYNTRVVTTEADVLIEQITLFVVLAQHGDVTAQLTTTDVKKTALVDAKNALAAYTQHPVLPCPIHADPVNE